METKNLLFIMTDQQTIDTLGVYGNEIVSCAGTDRLGAEGAVFERCYVASPICCPSRASLWTSQPPRVHGVLANDDGRDIQFPTQIPSLGTVLSENGYSTGYFGKWHLGNELSPQAGWQEWWTHLRGSYEQYLEESGLFRFQSSDRYDQRAEVPYELAHDTAVTDRTIDFIERHQHEHFAVVCSLRAPHDPYVGPFDGLYSPSDVTLPANCRDELDNKPRSQHSGRPREQFLALGDSQQEREERLREVVSSYWGLVHLVELNVVRMLETLDRLGLTDNTLVVFTSDHGDMMGAHGLLSKGNFMYEESLKVPLILRCPDSVPNRRVPNVASSIDIVPTILDLLEIAVPEEMSGITLRQSWDYDHNRRSAAFAEVYETYGYWAPVFTVVTENWKYSWYLGDSDELYHLAEDPLELTNLANDAEHLETRRSLRSRIVEWLEATGDLRLSELARLMPEYAPDLISR